jgi:hypothetical protein
VVARFAIEISGFDCREYQFDEFDGFKSRTPARPAVSLTTQLLMSICVMQGNVK